MSDLIGGLVRRDGRNDSRNDSRGTDLHNFSDIRNIVFLVADRLDVDTFGLLIDSPPEFFLVVIFHPLHADAKFLEEHCKVCSLAEPRLLFM